MAKKIYTHRQLVEAQHKAAAWAWRHNSECVEKCVHNEFPLPPKETRPRIVSDKWHMAWKYEGGEFWYSLSDKDLEWKRNDSDECQHELTPCRAVLWADLLARPTEEVAE